MLMQIEAKLRPDIKGSKLQFQYPLRALGCLLRATSTYRVMGAAILLGSAAHVWAIEFDDITAESGISYVGESKGAAWSDFNQDGWPDIWVTNRYAPMALYVNEGDGTFVDSSFVIETVSQFAYGAAWGDFDNDGDPDVLNIGPGGCSGICGTVTANTLLVNEAGMLTDQAAAYGVDYPQGRGRMPLWFDWNNDGQLDVLLVNGARHDGLAPTALFTQAEGYFIDDTQTAGISPEDSLYAHLARLAPGLRPHIFLMGWEYPQAIYDYASLPFLDIKASIGFPISGGAYDAAIVDLNGDLLTDVFQVRAAQYPSAVILVDTQHVDAQLTVSASQKAFRFKAPGNVQFEIKGSELSLAEIYIGANAVIEPDEFTFALSSDDPAVHGIYPHEPGVETGIYIGYEPTTGFWEVQSSSSSWRWRVIRVGSESTISELATVGFESSDGEKPDRLVLQNEDGFSDATMDAGLGMPTSCGSVVAADFDNDMDLDLYLVCRGALDNRPNLLYENGGDGMFQEVPGAGGATGSTVGRGDSAAAADYNGDGFMDLFVTNGDEGPTPFNQGPHQLFRNLGNENHWLEIDLEGTRSNRDGVGAQVLVTAGGVAQVRDQNAGIHSYNQDHSRLHFGLGPNTTVDRLDIYWPSGREQRIVNIPADSIIRITEPGPAFSPGKPSYFPGQDAGVYLWKESFDGPYHLRVSGDDGPLTLFDTTLLAESAFEAVVPLQLETNDIITHQDNTLSLASWVMTWEDGVDFTLPPGTAALISVEQDGVPNPRQLHVGPSGDPIAPAGFVLNVNELPALPAFEAGRDLGLFIGQSVAGNISARLNGDGFAHRTTLKLVSSNPLLDVEPVGLEELQDTLTEGPYHLQVSGKVSTGWDGVDVSIAPNSRLGIYYEQDGLFQSHRVNPLTRGLGLPNAYALPVADVGGEPDYEPATEKGLYLWQDEDGTWHLRVTAGGDFGRYTGAIVASAPFSGVTGVALEANDLLDVSDPTQILFDLSVGTQWTDGIDFAIPKGIEITLHLNDNTATAAELVNIGGERWPVNQLPVRLQRSTPVDTDSDGVVDSEDNCTLVPNGPLIPDSGGNTQLDTDGDGYGNICDADLNGDLKVDLSDFSFFRIAFDTQAADADFNGDGEVNLSDFSIFRTLFGNAPGPSGLNP